MREEREEGRRDKGENGGIYGWREKEENLALANRAPFRQGRRETRCGRGYIYTTRKTLLAISTNIPVIFLPSNLFFQMEYRSLYR